MQTTKQLIAKAKKAQGIESDYRLAQLLGVVNSAVTNWQSGRSHPADDVAARLAELAGQHPESVIAELHAERAKSPEMKRLWLQMAQHLRHAVALVMLGVGAAMLFLAPSPGGAQAGTLTHQSGASSLYIMLNNIHSLRR